MIENVAMTNRDKDDHAGNAVGDAGGKHDKRKPRKFSQYHHGNKNRPYNNYYGKTRYQGGGGDKRHFNKRARFDVGERLKEVDLGITEYVGNAEGFSGTIKERFTDFVVHEISTNGEIAKLTSQEIPPDPEDLLDLEELKKQVPSDIWEKLQEITEDKSGIEIDVTEMGKEQRKVIHQIVKKLTTVVSETKEIGSKKLIVFSKQYANRFGSRAQDNRVDWSDRGGNYCHFILHKVNMDTMDALNQISRVLHLKSSIFSYSGTKDRRAKTTQWICVKKMNPRKIFSAAKAVRGAFVGNFKFEKDPLKLGKLYGNRFTIALRNVTAADDLIEKAMVSLRDNGFINYYGLQRFGTIAAIPTYEIGKALLKGDWAEAVDLILKPREGEQDTYLAEAREIYKNTKDSRLAYQKIGGRRDKIEAKLLWGLNICGQKNLQGALDMVPRNTMLMYVHAYQSFVWNIMVSRRIKEFGLQPVVGDLVYENPDLKDDAEIVIDDGHHEIDDDSKPHFEEPADASIDDQKTDDESKSKKDESEKQASAESHSSQEKKEEKPEDDKASDKGDYERPLPKVKILTKEDLPNYIMADIIMPQPGWKVTYPAYAKSWFEEILEKDGLTPDLKQKNKKYTLSGSYRKIFHIPQHLSWKILRYNNKSQDLILSDVDELRDVEPLKDEPEGVFKALIVQMSLQSSCYATMALREALKCDTSSQTHAAQTAAFQEAHEKSEEDKIKEQGKRSGSESEDIPHVEKLKLERSNQEVYLSAEDLATEKKINVSAASSALEDSMSSKTTEKAGSSMLEESLLEEKTDGKTQTQKHEADIINDSGIEPGPVMSA